jgi:hypothetical protein
MSAGPKKANLAQAALGGIFTNWRGGQNRRFDLS